MGIKFHLGRWFVLRFVPPLLLAAGVLLLRRGSPVMPTFVTSIWIGFVVHALGWFVIRHNRGVDAVAFIPLFFFYGRVADITLHGGFLNQEWIIIAIVSYAAYLFLAALSCTEERDGAMKDDA